MTPSELYDEIVSQRESCNALLAFKNARIAALLKEVAASEKDFQDLVEQYHENIQVLSSRMETQVSCCLLSHSNKACDDFIQVQTLESLVEEQRSKMEAAVDKERKEQMQQRDRVQ